MSRKIDVMIVGAQKAGTTSLLRYLGEHPQCIAHPQKEFAYFLDSEEFKNGFENAFLKYFSDHDISPDTKIIAKSAGLYSNIDAIQKLYYHNPKCKLILILRNPVERAYSSYLMEKNAGSAKFEFSDLPYLLNKHEENDESWGFSFFIDYGHYALYLKKIYQFFPKEQVKVLLFRDLRSNATDVCKDIFTFLEINPKFIPNVRVMHNVTLKNHSQIYARFSRRLLANKNPLKIFLKFFLNGNRTYKYGEFLRNINKSKNKHKGMDSEVRKFLVNYYKPHNAELEKMLGKDLADWNK